MSRTTFPNAQTWSWNQSPVQMFGVCADSVSTCTTYRLRHIHLVFGIPRQIAEHNIQPNRTSHISAQPLDISARGRLATSTKTLNISYPGMIIAVSIHHSLNHNCFLALVNPRLCLRKCVATIVVFSPGVELVQTAAGMINFVQLIIKWFVL